MGCGDVQRFRGGLVFKAHRLLYHSNLGLRVKKESKKEKGFEIWGLRGGQGLVGPAVNDPTLDASQTLLEVRGLG